MKIPSGKSIKCHDLDEPSDIDDLEQMCDNVEDENERIEELTDLLIEEINADENEIQIEEISAEENQGSSSNQPGKMPINVLKNNFDEGTWVAVNYGRIKPKLYFGKFTRVIRKDYLYEGSFTRQKSSKLPKLHVFPDVRDFCEFLLEDIVRIVSPPKYLRKGILQFYVSLNNIIQAMN